MLGRVYDAIVQEEDEQMPEFMFRLNPNMSWSVFKGVHAKLSREIEQKMQERLRGSGPRALSVIEELMTRADSEQVRLGAAKDMLDRGGYRAYEEEGLGKTVEEMEQQLIALVGKDGAKMLVSSVRTRKSISGPQLAEG